MNDGLLVSFSVIDIGKEMGDQKIDDFSKVRNRFIESLNDEEYILFLDSDEEAPRLLLKLCKAIVYTGVPYYRVRRVNLNGWKWAALANPDYCDRFVSNKVRYQGKVHESVRPRFPYAKIEVPIIHNHTGPIRYTAPPYYFHGVRLDIVPLVFRWYAAFNHMVSMIMGET